MWEEVQREIFSSRTEIKRSDSPVPSCVSMKSDDSMGLPVHFKEKRESTPERDTKEKISDYSGPSSSSMNSDVFIEPPADPSSTHSATEIKRSDSPVPSCVSMKSDDSMGLPVNFKEKRESTPERVLQGAREKTHQIIITDTGCKSVSTEPHLQERCKLNLLKKFQHVNEVITN
ncbi:hypothetical protein AMELA_G00244880, partial [Ameiurus melas]